MVLFDIRSVHSVCLWDEKGAPRVQQALQQDIVEFIRDAQIVRMHLFYLLKLLVLACPNVMLANSWSFDFYVCLFIVFDCKMVIKSELQVA